MARKKILVLGVVVILSLSVIGFVFAGPWGPGHRSGFKGSTGWMRGNYGMSGPYCSYYGANLTQEQLQKINELHTKFYNETLPLREKIQQKRLELRGLYLQTNPDQAKINKAINELNSLKTEFQKKRAQLVIEIKKIAPEAPMRGMRMGYGWRGGRRCMW